MPFKSEAQRRKFHAMAKSGEISQAKVNEWERHTHGKLPERARAKRKAKKYTESKNS